jgi:hypothetical protein
MLTSSGCTSLMGRGHETRVVVTHAGNNCLSHNHGALPASLVAPGCRANYTLAWCVKHALSLCPPTPIHQRWTGPAERDMVESPGAAQGQWPGESGCAV